jgi:hypothetical protein
MNCVLFLLKKSSPDKLSYGNRRLDSSPAHEHKYFSAGDRLWFMNTQPPHLEFVLVSHGGWNSK